MVSGTSLGTHAREGAVLHQCLLDLSDAAKLAPRRVECLARIHPISNEALLEQGKMFPKFVIQFLVQPRPAQRRPDAGEKHSQHWISAQSLAAAPGQSRRRCAANSQSPEPVVSGQSS